MCVFPQHQAYQIKGKRGYNLKRGDKKRKRGDKKNRRAKSSKVGPLLEEWLLMLLY